VAGARRRGVCLFSTAAEEGVRKNRRESCRGAHALQGKLSGGGSWEVEWSGAIAVKHSTPVVTIFSKFYLERNARRLFGATRCIDCREHQRTALFLVDFFKMI
jgi:hypothetical protein